MSRLYEILEHKRRFVASRSCKAYSTTKIPEKKMVALTCTDTRPIELRLLQCRIHDDVVRVSVLGQRFDHQASSSRTQKSRFRTHRSLSFGSGVSYGLNGASCNSVDSAISYFNPE